MLLSKGNLRSHDEKSKDLAAANVRYDRSQILIDLIVALAKLLLEVWVIYFFYRLVGQGKATAGDYFAYLGIKEVIVASLNGVLQLPLRDKEFTDAMGELDRVLPVEEF